MDGRSRLTRKPRAPDSAFWVDPADIDEASGRLRLSPSESRHLLRSFRAAPGTRFEAVDGRGHLYRCLLESSAEGLAEGRIESRIENAGELEATIDLVVGLPDLPQAEAIVSLAVPLGVARIDLVAVARSDRGPFSKARIDRLSRIARSALKQSRRTRMPSIISSQGLVEALDEVSDGSVGLLADPDGQPLRVLPPAPGARLAQPSVALAIGPPGGFLAEEVGLLKNRRFSPISLGPSRLTTSVATISLLAATRNLLLTMGLGQFDNPGSSGYLH